MLRSVVARTLAKVTTVVVLSSLSCASAARDAGAAEQVAGASQKGRASYYADSLAGNKTASGEPYDPSAMTAAHRTLPFGTIVMVRSGERSVKVRINDRGPFGGKGRIIDLSRAAAEELGMVKAGVVDVTVEVVERP